MASTHAKALRRADVLQRLSDRLGIDQADLYINARGDKEMALVITLERIADAVEQRTAAVDDPLVTIETVEEKPLKTTETVEIVDTGTGTVIDSDKSKTKARK